MNIDFPKLIKLLLPTFVRNGLKLIIEPIAAQLTVLYSDFKIWQADIRLQSAMTCQVMYLEAILNYRLLGTFNRIITVGDGDGITVDFIVIQPVGVVVDNYRMIALIEKYKTFGKRYRIDQMQYTYEIAWTDFVCEQELEAVTTYETSWTDFVCEKEFNLDENYISYRILSGEIQAVADFNVASTVEVTLFVVYNGGSHEYISLIISQNNYLSDTVFRDEIQSVEITAVNPEEDSQYFYTYGLQ